ncbi:MAG TPA: hypothetical protein VKF42_01610 [Chitinivibrionales bacterium]|nr:hypothetical protein [Chitinivibrionales bacterium]
MKNPVTSLHLLAEQKSGVKTPVDIKIGHPYEIETPDGKKHSACSIDIEGLFASLPDIQGEDSFQALSLAIRFVEQQLLYFMRKGGLLYYEDGSPFDIKPYFQQLEMP